MGSSKLDSLFPFMFTSLMFENILSWVGRYIRWTFLRILLFLFSKENAKKIFIFDLVS